MRTGRGGGKTDTRGAVIDESVQMGQISPMKFIMSGARSLALLLSFLAAGFSAPATDSPTNYTTATWTNGANLGSGFGPWQLSTVGNANPTPSYFNVGYGNFSNTITWNIDSDTTSSSSAGRGFKILDVGESVGIVFKIDAVSNLSSRVGFRLMNGTNQVFFTEYEDESNRWNVNNTQSWVKADPLAVTEFNWFREGVDSYGYTFKYDGATIVGVSGLTWTNLFPDGIEIYSAYQGVETGGIAVSSIEAPAIVPEPSGLALLIFAVGLGAIAKLARRVGQPLKGERSNCKFTRYLARG
jgi:hypothetical protein